jgi:hypothetical protein
MKEEAITGEIVTGIVMMTGVMIMTGVTIMTGIGIVMIVVTTGAVDTN